MSLDIINLNSILRAAGETLKQISSRSDNREPLINSSSLAVWYRGLVFEAQLDPDMDHTYVHFERSQAR
jgi:hypothetical protein